MPRSRLRRALLVGLVLVLVAAAVAAVLAWRTRRELAEAALREALAARGATPASLRVRAVGPGGLVVEDLVIGDPPDLRVGRLEVTLDATSARAGRIAAARAEGVELRGRIGPEGLDLGAAQELLLGGEGEDAAAPLALPARRVALRDARALLDTPAGPVTVDGTFDGREEEDGTLHLRAEAEATHRLGRVRALVDASGPPRALAASLALELAPSEDLPLSLAAPLGLGGTAHLEDGAATVALEGAPVGLTVRAGGRHLEGTLPHVTLRAALPADGDPELELDASGGHVQDAQAGLRAELGALRASGAPEALEAHLALALRDLREPARMAPLHAELRASGAPDALRATLDLRDPQGEALARLEAEAPATPRGRRLRIELAPVDLAALDLAQRLPALERMLGDELAASGTLEGRVRADPGADGAWDADVDLALRDVGLVTPLASLRGLYGRLHVVGPPWRTPEPQRLAMALVDVGLPLEDGQVELLLHPEGRVEVREATWRFAGGRLRAGADLALLTAHQSGVLLAEGLDVATLAALLEVEGLAGTGTLAGALPVFRDGDRLEVRQGVLRSVGGGTLRWHPAGRDALAARPGMDVLLAALDDFHYDRIELELDGDLRGAMEVQLHLRGSNPNLQQGRPVELNVSVDARLADLVAAGRASYRVPEIVEKRLRDFSAGRNR